MYLTLDLSLKNVGWAKFSNDCKLIKSGNIIPKEDLPNTAKIFHITNEIKSLFDKVEEVVIEDIYYGGNSQTLIWLARLSGAVACAWFDMSYKIPYWMKATHARSLVEGIKGNSKKAEIQCFVIDKYNMLNKASITGYKSKITKLQNQYKDKEISKYKFGKKLGEVSENIKEVSGMDDNRADSIVLGLAYYEEVLKGD